MASHPFVSVRYDLVLATLDRAERLLDQADHELGPIYRGGIWLPRDCPLIPLADHLRDAVTALRSTRNVVVAASREAQP